MSPPCPWEGLVYRPAEFCEESLCAWIRQPGNTWTNVGFLLAGLAIWRAARRDGFEHLYGLAWIALATGIGSAFFHASETFVGRLFDYSGMYLGGSYMLAVNARRWLLWSRTAIRVLFWTSAAAPLLLMFVDDEYALSVYFFEGLFCCGFLEAILYLRQRRVGPRVKYRWLAGYWLVFLIAMTFWWLDKTRVLCSPGNHWISGHGVWHLLDALALYLVYLFYRQFEVLRFRGIAHGSARI
ncbi:MAG TPA: ceramidase domain-containing protein [Thermoanaerobaculia bacterium]|nr:ceramidase domain-containing protein [Thermoanaerobaculia bacterium]